MTEPVCSADLLTSSWAPLALVSGLVKTAEINLHGPKAAQSRVQSLVLVVASDSERLAQRVIEYCSLPPRRFSRQAEERGPRLIEVRLTKVGAEFSGIAEGGVDRDRRTQRKEKRQPAGLMTESNKAVTNAYLPVDGSQ